MPIDNDQLHRFIFDDTDIRGEIITLHDSLRQLLENKRYPDAIKPVLGEFMAAAALLSTTLKFDGLLTLQARGDGYIPLIMAETEHNNHNNKKLRGIVKINESLSIPEASSLPAMIGQGVLSITIDPDHGKRYQGIVPLDAPSLADCLEHYFSQSEQLPTRLWLTSDGNTASGLLLQQLPQQLADPELNQFTWENRVQLANTITGEELLSLNHQDILTRLFHEEGVRCFEPSHFSFGCRCSKERSSNALVHLGKEDVQQLLLEQGLIVINCEFCGFEYSYDHKDIEEIFSPKTQH